MSPAIKPMLGDLELPLVQHLETAEGQVLVNHAVPGLAGAFTQSLNRRATALTVHGMLAGDDALERLEQMRQQFHDAAPLAFVADIMTATAVQQVFIADLSVAEVAGKPQQFAYRLALSEYVPPPPDETVAQEAVDQKATEEASTLQEQQTEQLVEGTGTLEVRLDETLRERVQRVVASGRTSDGEEIRREVTAPEGDLYVFRDLPLGDYLVTAET